MEPSTRPDEVFMKMRPASSQEMRRVELSGVTARPTGWLFLHDFRG